MEPLELVLASENPNKVKEFQRILKGLAKVICLQEIEFKETFPEEGVVSFRENASQKALFVAQKTHRITIADDSGFEVTALKNAPGVISARYGGSSDPKEQRSLILSQMQSQANRSARFICELAYFDPILQELQNFRGSVEGQVSREERGEKGFGYDPIFIPEGLDQTFAEISPQEKDKLSHRGRAIHQLRELLVSRSNLSG